MNEKGDEEQHKAEQFAKAVTSRFGRLSTIEERYLLMLEVAGRQTADQAPLRFYTKKEEGLLFNVIFELSDAGLIKSKAYREHGKTISDVRDCVAVFGITYRGRMELGKLLRERRERVWWRRGLWALWRGLKYVLCAFAGAGGASGGDRRTRGGRLHVLRSGPRGAAAPPGPERGRERENPRALLGGGARRRAHRPVEALRRGQDPRPAPPARRALRPRPRLHPRRPRHPRTHGGGARAAGAVNGEG